MLPKHALPFRSEEFAGRGGEFGGPRCCPLGRGEREDEGRETRDERPSSQPSDSGTAEDLILRNLTKPTKLPLRRCSRSWRSVVRSPKWKGGGRQSCPRTKRLDEGAGWVVGRVGDWWECLGNEAKGKAGGQQDEFKAEAACNGNYE